MSKDNRAFTLIELIIAVAIIALLAAAYFIVVNPSKRLGQSKDSRRWSDLQSLTKAVEIYTADNGHLPADLNVAGISTCEKIVLCSSPATLSCAGQINNCLVVDDTDFLGVYLSQLPIDPSKSAITDTGYYITRTAGGLIAFGACDSYQTTPDLAIKSVVSFPAYLGDPCDCKTVGQAASGGAICAGAYNAANYMVTPSGCQDTSCTGAGGTDSLVRKWQNASTLTGANSTSDGAANTTAILTADASAPAALFCSDMSYGGYTDWFLPSKNELNGVLYNNKVALGGFVLSGGGPYWTFYWSSTELNTTLAWGQYFINGTQEAYYGGKTSSFYVRCIRKY